METLLKMKASGAKVPALERRPKLPLRLRILEEEFSRLSKDRRKDQGSSLPLTTTEILTYARYRKIARVEDFAETIERVDQIYLRLLKEAQAKEAQKKTPPSPALTPKRGRKR